MATHPKTGLDTSGEPHSSERKQRTLALEGLRSPVPGPWGCAAGQSSGTGHRWGRRVLRVALAMGPWGPQDLPPRVQLPAGLE